MSSLQREVGPKGNKTARAKKDEDAKRHRINRRILLGFHRFCSSIAYPLQSYDLIPDETSKIFNLTSYRIKFW